MCWLLQSTSAVYVWVFPAYPISICYFFVCIFNIRELWQGRIVGYYICCLRCENAIRAKQTKKWTSETLHRFPEKKSSGSNELEIHARGWRTSNCLSVPILFGALERRGKKTLCWVVRRFWWQLDGMSLWVDDWLAGSFAARVPVPNTCKTNGAAFNQCQTTESWWNPCQTQT